MSCRNILSENCSRLTELEAPIYDVNAKETLLKLIRIILITEFLGGFEKLFQLFLNLNTKSILSIVFKSLKSPKSRKVFEKMFCWVFLMKSTILFNVVCVWKYF